MLVLLHPIFQLIFPILLALVSIFILDSLITPFNDLTSDYNDKISIFTALRLGTQPATVISSAAVLVSNFDVSLCIQLT
jgi:hypothetical protein